MTHLERVACSLGFKEPDRVPVYPICSGVSRLLTGISYYDFANDARKSADAMIAVTRELDLDVICTLTDLSVEAEDFGQKLDYPETEAAHPVMNERLITCTKDYYNIEPIDVKKARRMNVHLDLCDILSKEMGKEYPIVAFVFGPLGITSMLRDQASMYMDIIDDPDAVKHAVGAITETLIQYCDLLIDRGVHAIMFDTLFSSASIMRKSMWVEFEGWAVERLAKHVHDKGCMVMIHNCGNGIYFDVQIEAMKPEAISFLHAPDDCKDLAECKAKYGGVTTLIGCVPPTWLPSASYEEVVEESKKEIDTMAKGGGFILATGCEYPANLDLGAARAMVETAKTYGVYKK
ncbi:MAG: uroporphyrinogen decarboxylase family protein [Abditibacteriota bacterium]|nr:uroporphyrinogen decarboxylase family protein [Abditibacteriota bacterium]